RCGDNQPVAENDERNSDAAGWTRLLEPSGNDVAVMPAEISHRVHQTDHDAEMGARKSLARIGPEWREAGERSRNREAQQRKRKPERVAAHEHTADEARRAHAKSERRVAT